MAQETVQLARFATALCFEHLPPAVIQRAKDAIADAVGPAAFGATLPWSRIVLERARLCGGFGGSRVLARGGERRVRAPAHAVMAARRRAPREQRTAR
jgi:2-methylcitrate dehydratase PrpD